MKFDKHGFSSQTGYVIYNSEEKIYQGETDWTEDVTKAKFYKYNSVASDIVIEMKNKLNLKVCLRGITRTIQIH